MKKKQLHNKLRLLIILTLLLLGLIGFALGKYMTTITLGNNEATFTARLAQNVELRESEISRKADGTYEITAETITNATQSYTLVPGQDIPKDPHIVITGKTDIPAYLYVEIVDTLDTVRIGEQDVKLINYSVTSDWTKMDDPGQYGGTVYRYNTKLETASVTATYYILNNNQVTVSQHVKSHDIATNGDTDILTFYAYLIEATD